MLYVFIVYHLSSIIFSVLHMMHDIMCIYIYTYHIIYTAHLLVVTPPLISQSCHGDLPVRYKTGPVALTLSLPFSLSLRIGTGATSLEKRIFYSQNNLWPKLSKQKRGINLCVSYNFGRWSFCNFGGDNSVHIIIKTTTWSTGLLWYPQPIDIPRIAQLGLWLLDPHNEPLNFPKPTSGMIPNQQESNSRSSNHPISHKNHQFHQILDSRSSNFT